MHAFAPAATTPSALETALERDFPARVLDLGDASTQIRESGAGVPGPALVLLHGIGSGAGSWLPTVQRLAGQVRMIAWDAPGYGQSRPLTVERPRAEDYAGRLDAVLEALAVRQVVLVGHSLGAMTALAYARANAQKVGQLVLISPARGYGAPERREQGRAVRTRRLNNLANLGVTGIADQRAPAMLSSTPTREALDWVHWNMSRLNPPGYRQAVELLCGDDLLRQGKPAMPVRVYCGAADGITMPDACWAIAKSLDAPFELIPGAGHASPIERPDGVAERLAETLSHCVGNLS